MGLLAEGDNPFPLSTAAGERLSCGQPLPRSAALPGRRPNTVARSAFCSVIVALRRAKFKLVFGRDDRSCYVCGVLPGTPRGVRHRWRSRRRPESRSLGDGRWGPEAADAPFPAL